jgi:hypothetical protein
VGYAGVFLVSNFTGAFATAVIVPTVGLAVALPAHYPWDLATPGHLGPVYLAVLIFLTGVVAAYSGMRSPGIAESPGK